jgi:spore germination cell wall hydrolase CwlJ-like protein
VKSAGYPHSICGVVYQGAALRHACQFSFTCSGELLHPKTPGAWASARRLAAKILNGLIQLGDVTEDAISFHAADVEPGWGDSLVRTIQIGNHVFYRAAPRSTEAS